MRLRGYEGQQGRVYFLGVSPQQAVRRALYLDVVSLGERLVEAPGGGIDGQDVICGPMQDQCRLTAGPNRFNIASEVLNPGRDHRVGGDRRARGGGVPAGGDRLLANALSEDVAEVVKVAKEVGELGESIIRGLGDDVVEDLLGDAGGVIVACDQEWFE